MQALPQNQIRTDQDILADWLARAGEDGVEDLYRGKRAHPRVTWQAPVSIEFPDSSESAGAAFAYASDVSQGGMSVRCRQEAEVFSRMCVTLDETGESLYGKVRHCTRTTTGFVIGIEFQLGSAEQVALRKSA